MSDSDVSELRNLIGEVRRTFRLLAGLSDNMLEKRGLTATLRAILEFVAENGPSPVPRMAKAKSMKRQSVQSLVDRLQKLGLVETVPNPQHLRSVLVALTDKGEAAFQAILIEEKNLLTQIAGDWPKGGVRQACATLADFQRRLTPLRSMKDVRDTEFEH
ncbi:MarR family protein [Roseibium album]|nr:MarR family protein [Roseibium album]